MHRFDPRARPEPALLACVLALAGCGSGDGGGTPAACAEGGERMRAALRSAPARVRIDGVALSDCLGEDSGGTDIQRVGAGYLEAAAALGAPARRAPEGRAAVQLGYLIGAVRRGTAGSQGVYSELVRRLEQEAAPLRGRSRAFRRGERAGRRSG